ncbi:YDG/SRA domain-containing protein [Solirubrum puertoriconensis]|uniref:YDG/SRA domain-containing protein n=1 Tax=Solirubrum puertoriconensis TaxID=1751427 RepID=UPI00098F18B8|nr:YDG/SRA domain-containing protein [Solirubrum puertoriconensis]
MKHTNIAFGHVPGVPVGAEFENRRAVQQAGLHRDWMKGISYASGQAADAIVLSGGYEDDLDLGSTILYTGQGGNSEGQQVADQTLTRGNKALHLSYEQQTPIRVIRKVVEGRLEYYQYAGLYKISQWQEKKGKSGFLIYQFLLVEADNSVSEAPATVISVSQVAEEAGEYGPARRETSTVVRLVRDTAVMRNIKSAHGFACQVCGIVLQGPKGPYAEAAHIRPLGAPHHGPDKLDNVLCLCPNHHVLFDLGAWSVATDGSLLGLPGQLRITDTHQPNPEHITYHRATIYARPSRR